MFPFTLTENRINKRVPASFFIRRISTFISNFRSKKNTIHDHRIRTQSEVR